MQLRVAEHWFETLSLDDGVTLIREPHVDPAVRCNLWHVRGRDRDLLLDTGMGLRELRAEVALLRGREVLCVASHTHFDHIGGHHEFEQRLVHRAEAGILAAPGRDSTAVTGFVEMSVFSALPCAGFEPERYQVRAAPATGLLDEGDRLDLGDRVFEVLHLPGHSPGSIALWETSRGILFSGDVVYDGRLYDDVYHSDIDAYRESMRRLRELPVTVVHGGHYASFGAARYVSLIDAYLESRRRPCCPARRG